MTHLAPLSVVESRLAEAGISVAALCRRAGISQTTWHKWKTRDIRPRESTVRVVTQALADLGVSMPAQRAEQQPAPDLAVVQGSR